MRKDTILIIGANGQLGTVLTRRLREILGQNQVIASDIRLPKSINEPFEQLNILDSDRLVEVVKKYNVSQIYHLAAILSAKGEINPMKTWEINMTGLFNVLEVAKEHNIDKVFFPSSIAAFGVETPRINTPQHTVLAPTTVYGISKAAGENWCQYYSERYDVDVRSIRYPGVIGYQSLPGGGTTDYAVEVFHKAILGEDFECFLSENTRLPMIYMDDVIEGTLQLMEAPKASISIRTSYNLGAINFTPKEIVSEIRNYIPSLKVSYKPDFRQQIAESWPESIDDSCARKDWGWSPKFDLPAMTKDMILQLNKQYRLVV